MAPHCSHFSSSPCWEVVVVVQLFNYVRLFETLWTAARQASLSFQGLLKLMSIESRMPSKHLILGHPFSSCPQSVPASGSFPMNWLFTSGGWSMGASASASVLPVNIQGWLLGSRMLLISLLFIREGKFQLGVWAQHKASNGQCRELISCVPPINYPAQEGHL